MRRFLLFILTPWLVSSTTANAESEFTKLEPINPYSYKKSTLTRWKEGDIRYISFKGTTRIPACEGINCGPLQWDHRIKKKFVEINSLNQIVWSFTIDCEKGFYDRKGDKTQWMNIRHDQTAELMANKYCPLSSWNKLPVNKNR
tara:strand:- start:277 stop:708 length:432 start_codon:yes stop_codon:yes gene_type:complete